METEKFIMSFDGEYAFLSNFANSPIFYDGIVYPTNEHFFQAMKTLDEDERLKIAEAPTPGVAKRLGRKVQLRSDWEKIKVDIMRLGLQLKFTNRELAQKLMNTGDARLIEGNSWHDNTWGICFCEKCQNTSRQNLLGELLMKLRERLKEEM